MWTRTKHILATGEYGANMAAILFLAITGWVISFLMALEAVRMYKMHQPFRCMGGMDEVQKAV